MVCWLQVMSQVSAARAIPPHNPEATSAEDAYKADEVISEHDLQHLHVSTIQEALLDSSNLQALRSSETWLQLKPLVRFVLQMRLGPGEVSPLCPFILTDRKCLSF